MKIFGIVGWKNSGKTGLMERLVSEFTERGLVVSTLKHAHHEFEIDHEGRDTFRHREAGAKEVAIVSSTRWALMHELQGMDEPDPEDMINRMEPVDLLLIEGFKNWKQPKLFCHRAETGPYNPGSIDPVAVASDVEIEGLTIPRYDLNDTARISGFIAYHLDL